MYIQPYEPQEMTFGPSTLSGYGAAPSCAPSEAPFAGDGVAAEPWTQEMPGIGDAASALNDAPFGSLGIGNMLASLTGMMQQLTQMMQSLLGRMGGPVGNQAQCGGGACTQASQAAQRVPLE